MIDRTAYLYYSNCSFSAVNHWIKAKVKKKKKKDSGDTVLADWLSLTAQFVNHQQTIWHVLTSPPSTMTHQMRFLHHLQWEPKRCTLMMTIWSSPSLCCEWSIWSGAKEMIAGNAAALMAHAAANLTYIIHAASESEQQHMFPHDACGLEVQQHCDSTPLRSDGNFSLSSRTQNGFKAGHRVCHASWWCGDNIDHL